MGLEDRQKAKAMEREARRLERQGSETASHAIRRLARELTLAAEIPADRADELAFIFTEAWRSFHARALELDLDYYVRTLPVSPEIEKAIEEEGGLDTGPLERLHLRPGERSGGVEMIFTEAKGS